MAVENVFHVQDARRLFKETLLADGESQVASKLDDAGLFHLVEKAETFSPSRVLTIREKEVPLLESWRDYWSSPAIGCSKFIDQRGLKAPFIFGGASLPSLKNSGSFHGFGDGLMKAYAIYGHEKIMSEAELLEYPYATDYEVNFIVSALKIKAAAKIKSGRGSLIDRCGLPAVEEIGSEGLRRECLKLAAEYAAFAEGFFSKSPGNYAFHFPDEPASILKSNIAYKVYKNIAQAGKGCQETEMAFYHERTRERWLALFDYEYGQKRKIIYDLFWSCRGVGEIFKSRMDEYADILEDSHYVALIRHKEFLEAGKESAVATVGETAAITELTRIKGMQAALNLTREQQRIQEEGAIRQMSLVEEMTRKMQALRGN